MKMVMTLLSLVCALVISLLDNEVRCESPSSDVSTKDVDLYSPEYLFSLGQTLNSPLLRLMGLVTLCNGQPLCSEWSVWSTCSAERPGKFGIRNRTRLCGSNDPRCRPTANLNEENQTDRTLCEGFCPGNYNLTKHGFCLKFSQEKLTHTTAVAHCKQDGGYLVNVNSDNKLEDIRAIYKGVSYVYIDGERPNINSPWEYTYGPEPVDLNWSSGQPNNDAGQLCMFIDKTFGRHDGVCNGLHYFICEIINDGA